MTAKRGEPETIGVAIVGTGSISRAHIEGYRQFPESCRIVAVVDIVAERAQAAAAAIGPDVAWYTDFAEAYARDDVHLVSVCTPPFVHAPAAIAALEAGKHVLVEKPMAASLEEADAMLAAAKAHDRILSVVFQYRFGADWWRAKQVVASGLLGELHFGKAECQWWRGESYYDAWWRGTWEMECGGAVINHAVHHIDMLLWLMGPVESVYAEIGTVAHDIEVEDLGLAIVRFQSGALGHIVGTVADHHNLDRIEVTGSQGAISLPWRSFAVKERPDGFPQENPEAVEAIEQHFRSVTPPETRGHAPQIADILAAIREGRQPIVDGEEGRRSLELITAMYRSASTGERVKLPIDPADPFYTTEGLRKNVLRRPTTRSRKAGGQSEVG